jgi:hypothetical protein
VTVTSRIATIAILEAPPTCRQVDLCSPRRGDGFTTVELPANRYTTPFLCCCPAVLASSRMLCREPKRSRLHCTFFMFLVPCTRALVFTDSSRTSLCPRFKSRPPVPKPPLVHKSTCFIIVRLPVFDGSLFNLLLCRPAELLPCDSKPRSYTCPRVPPARFYAVRTVVYFCCRLSRDNGRRRVTLIFYVQTSRPQVLR